MNKFYKGSFYPEALKDVYISAGSWPENGVDVDDETMAIYTGVVPQGKMLGSDKNGNPAWVDIPPLSTEQLVAIMEQKKGKRAARTVLTGMCYSVGSATRQGSSSPTRFIGQSAMTSRT
ncbi:TPA: tail fiber assembly protein [Escherichia coli]